MPDSILILDKDLERSQSLASFLENNGYQAVCCVRGEEVVARLSENAHRISLIVLDFKQSENENFIAVKEIRKLSDPFHIPFLLCLEDDFKSGKPTNKFEAGTFDIVKKPIDRDTLLIRISVLCRLKVSQNKASKVDTTPIAPGKNKENRLSDSVSSFFAGMSHDLRNPIHGILSYANFGINKIDAKKLSEEKSRHYYLSIKEAANRLLILLNDILDLAKLDSGHIEFNIKNRNLAKITKGVFSEIRRLSEEHGVTFDLIEPSVPLFSRIDARYIGQAIRNLLTFALCNSSEGDHIVVKIEEDHRTLENRQNHRPQPAVKFTLRHNRVEIPDQKLNPLFGLLNDYETLDPKLRSFGLKLVLCHTIISMHDGAIWAKSRIEGGSDFCFLLPKSGQSQSDH